MRRRTPRFTLFPYTTLFRSIYAETYKLSFHRETRDLPVFALVIAQNGPKIHPAKPGDTYPNGVKCFGGDRKSTRLNSSHQIISYAVFCLKKKKKKNSQRHFK